MLARSERNSRTKRIFVRHVRIVDFQYAHVVWRPYFHGRRILRYDAVPFAAAQVCPLRLSVHDEPFSSVDSAIVRTLVRMIMHPEKWVWRR